MVNMSPYSNYRTLRPKYQTKYWRNYSSSKFHYQRYYIKRKNLTMCFPAGIHTLNCKLYIYVILVLYQFCINNECMYLRIDKKYPLKTFFFHSRKDYIFIFVLIICGHVCIVIAKVNINVHLHNCMLSIQTFFLITYTIKTFCRIYK